MYLKITDGMTTIDLLGNDATNSFNLLASEWAPNVARRKNSQLGGNWAEDVVETLPLYAQSNTDAATVLANLDTLAALIDQARRWYLGEPVDPVVIQYSPNSDSAYLESVILGPPDDGPGVLLPPTFSDDLYQRVVDGVVLQFKRRGLWLGDEESASGSSVANPGIVSATFSAQLSNDIPAPCIVEIGNFSYLNDQEIEPSILVVSPFSDAISILEAEGGAGGDFTSVSNSILDARGNNVLRYTPPDTDGDVSNSITISGLTAQVLGVIVVARNNSDTSEYLLSAQLETGVANGRRVETNKVPIGVVLDENDDSKPQIINLGIVASKNGFARIRFWVKAITVNESLDIDYIVLYDAERAQVVGLESLISYFTSDTYSLEVNHNLLTDIHPALSMRQSATRYYFGLTGDGNILSKKGTSSDSTYAAWIAVGSGSETAHWRYTSSSSVKNINMSVTRRPAYLVPQ